MPLETKSVWWGLYKSLDSKKPFLPWVKLCRLLLCQDGLCWACQVLSVINSPVDQRLVVVCLKDPRCHYFCFILILPLFIDYHSVTKFQNLVLFPLRRRGIILVRFCRIDVHLVDGSTDEACECYPTFELPFVLLCFVFRCWLCWKQKSQFTRCLFWFVQQVQCDATAGSIKEQISNMQIFSQCPTANNALRNLPAALAWLAISQGPSRKCRQHLLTSLLLSLRKAWQGSCGLCQKRGVFVKVVKVFWICPSIHSLADTQCSKCR